MNGLNAFERQYRTTGALAMIAQSVADILSHHVKLAVEGIDRMYLNIYVPKLQHEQGIVWFFREHRGLPVPSAAVMSPMSRNFVAKLEGYAAQHEVPLVANGPFDIGVTALPVQDERVDCELLTTVRTVLALPKGHPL